MTAFETLDAPAAHTVVAPDGSLVRPLLGLAGGGMALFELAPGQVAAAVMHRSVEEIWWVQSGEGQIWRAQAGREQLTDLRPGTCVTLPLGTRFQFRAGPDRPLVVLGVTMPPWPGPEEARPTAGPWTPSAAPPP